ncbi:malto-oligosyltrehalose trehalohydrolase, partial [Nitrospirota bacterium]
AQWNDDYHHALHTLLTGERDHYYRDFGEMEHLSKALREGFVYSGQHSEFRNRPHGTSSSHINPGRFVVFAQNHDQIGNRATGDRLTSTLDTKSLRLFAAAVILSPSIPLIFMGEEYAETAPFPYFISHEDPALVEAVRNGRKEEFPHHSGELPDPFKMSTFESARIDPAIREAGSHKEMFEFYKDTIKLRKSLTALRETPRDRISVEEYPETVLMGINHNGQTILIAICLSEEKVEVPLLRGGVWPMKDKLRRVLCTSERRPYGPWEDQKTCATIKGGLRLEPNSFALYLT